MVGYGDYGGFTPTFRTFVLDIESAFELDERNSYRCRSDTAYCTVPRWFAAIAGAMFNISANV